MEDTDKLCDRFRELYGSSPQEIYFAPGRVNLIGDHTDYNGGHVLPCALEEGTYGAFRLREDGRLRISSLNMDEGRIYEYGCSDLERHGCWTDYITGVLAGILKYRAEAGESCDCRVSEQKNSGSESRDQISGRNSSGPVSGAAMPGFDMLVFGDVPAGAGLSSSASLEVMTALAVSELLDLRISRKELALISQEAEHLFAGTNCGIMDQFISAFGKKDHAVYLDSDTLEYEYIPAKIGGYCFIIVNSMVKHELSSSAYNDRRRECAEALNCLKGAASLGSLGKEEFGELCGLIEDETIRKRAAHAVFENIRTAEACGYLKKGDAEGFGKLMYESHVSLRDLYEVSCPETDLLVEEAMNSEGVCGARMTGGGFGGCIVCLVKEDCADEFKKRITAVYSEKYGITPEIYPVVPSEGAHKIKKQL